MVDDCNVIILYGEMGAGKSHKAEVLAKQFGMEFFEGDSVMSKEMRERVENFRPLPREMLETFTHSHLFANIVSRAVSNPGGVMVAQALYRRDDRERLKERLEACGLRVGFVWVRTPFWRNFRQLLSRPRGWRWVLYWLLSKPFFQPPV